jgi:hypothetical protein
LATKAQRLHFVSRHYEDLATTSEAAGWRVYRRLVSGRKT